MAQRMGEDRTDGLRLGMEQPMEAGLLQMRTHHGLNGVVWRNDGESYHPRRQFVPVWEQKNDGFISSCPSPTTGDTGSAADVEPPICNNLWS